MRPISNRVSLVMTKVVYYNVLNAIRSGEYSSADLDYYWDSGKVIKHEGWTGIIKTFLSKVFAGLEYGGYSFEYFGSNTVWIEKKMNLYGEPIVRPAIVWFDFKKDKVVVMVKGIELIELFDLMFEVVFS